MSRLSLPLHRHSASAREECSTRSAGAPESPLGADNDATSECVNQAASADSGAPDLTFELSWTPLPTPPGTVFDAGSVPGSLVARIPVVVVRTLQLISSVERQLLANDGGEMTKCGAADVIGIGTGSNEAKSKRAGKKLFQGEIFVMQG